MASAAGPDIAGLQRRGFALEYASIAWIVLEAGVWQATATLAVMEWLEAWEDRNQRPATG